MQIPLGWQERLEQLRREQNPSRYNEERPVLHLPIPCPPPSGQPQRDEDDEDDEDRGVFQIQL